MRPTAAEVVATAVEPASWAVLVGLKAATAAAAAEMAVAVVPVALEGVDAGACPAGRVSPARSPPVPPGGVFPACLRRSDDDDGGRGLGDRENDESISERGALRPFLFTAAGGGAAAGARGALPASAEGGDGDDAAAMTPRAFPAMVVLLLAGKLLLLPLGSSCDRVGARECVLSRGPEFW